MSARDGCVQGCCRVPHAGVCARNRSCACHWDERKPASRSNGVGVHADPTANEAIRNVMKGQPR